MATWWRLNDISANLRVLLAIVSFLLYATTVWMKSSEDAPPSENG
jgi:hypothetical protein